jgi:hypothetical protein
MSKSEILMAIRTLKELLESSYCENKNERKIVKDKITELLTQL